MAKAHSLDLRRRILDAYDQGDVTQQQVAERFAVSRESVKKLLRQRRELGDITPQFHNCGAKPKITLAHREVLRELLKNNPDMTLEELRENLALDCTIQAIHYVLKDMGFSYKKRLSAQVNKTEKISP